jgi:hypothetical protein
LPANQVSGKKSNNQLDGVKTGLSGLGMVNYRLYFFSDKTVKYGMGCGFMFFNF